MYTREQAKDMIKAFFNRKNKSLSVVLTAENYSVFVVKLKSMINSMSDDLFFIGRTFERDKRFTALVDLRDTYNNACLIVDDNYDFILTQDNSNLVLKIYDRLICKILEMDEQIIAFTVNTQSNLLTNSNEMQ